MRSATYLYGFARAATGLPPGLTGVEGAPVAAIAIDGLAAVVAEVPADPFESDAPSDPAWLIPRALQHERVIEAMRGAGPVLPVRFGSLFSSRRALEGWASENRASIGVFLERDGAKEEWTIRLSLDLRRVAEGLAEIDPEWAERLRRLPASPGARYLKEKRLREAAAHEARRRAREVAARVREAARALADERLLSPRPPGEAGFEPVLNAAYLVAPVASGELRRRAASAASGLPGLAPEFSGPWAPSHFGPTLTSPAR